MPAPIPAVGEIHAFLSTCLDSDERRQRAQLSIGRTMRGEFETAALRAGRELAAKRAIVAAWQDNETERPAWPDSYADGLADGLTLAVRYILTIYSDRPGFRPEWDIEI